MENRNMLLRINEDTLVDPETTRIALVTGPAIAGEANGSRRIWVTTVARPGEAFEVEPRRQNDLLAAMRAHLDQYR
jgi:hypothetical protein